MPLTPGYGETPLSDDEADALLPQGRELLGEPITKADVYDLEQAVQEEVVEELVTSVLDGTLSVDELLADHFVRDLHRRLYGDIWAWAGGQHTDDWTARELGIIVHAETVRIHPFTDGNGRVTRLLADLVFIAAQDVETPLRYSWDLDSRVHRPAPTV